MKNVDVDNKQATAYIQHFSGFFSDQDVLNYNIKLFKTGSYFGGYFNLRTPFNQIPEDPNTDRYADEIIRQEDGLENCFVRITYELFEKNGLFFEEVADMTLYIKNNEENGTWSIWVDKANSSVPELPEGPEQIFHKYELDFEQMLDTWMSGYPFVAVFDENTYLDSDFEINEGNDYKMSAEWSIVKNYNGFLSPWTWTARYVRTTERKKWSEVSLFDDDQNQNNIEDSYEDNSGDNQSPNEPTIVNPSDGATDVSLNPTLEWDCSDPDGDEVSYNVWLDTENPPEQKVADNIHDDQYSAQSLEPNTIYYWAIDALDDNHTTNGPVWEFTTGEDGGGTVDLEWVDVEGGTFQMGCTGVQSNCEDDETPVHTVTLSSFEITNAQYAEFLNDINCNSDGSYNDDEYGNVVYIDMDASFDLECQINYSDGNFVAKSGKENHPVIWVSWYGANAFAQWAGGRLPTEAEWEFAARGGNQSQGYEYSGSDNLDEVGWYDDNSGGHTHEVGQKQPNELGIYDMSGNVWEWCSDWYDENYYSNSPENNPEGPSSGTYRVLRGGSWDYYGHYCRVAYRLGYNPGLTNYGNGFRIAR